MQALLVIAHGSRRPESNEEIRELTRRVAEHAGDAYPIVRHAFLELAEPSIEDGIEQCIRDGAREIIILPYFLSAGRHVVQDIPNGIRGKQAEHPQITIRVAPYLGANAGLAELLVKAASIPA